MPRQLAIILVLAALGALAGSTAARAGSPALAPDAADRALDASLLGDPAWKSPRADDAMMALVELDGPTAFDLVQAASTDLGVRPDAIPAASDLLYDAVARRQEPVRARLEALGATVISTYDSVLNGFLVQATPEQLRALAATPGVRLISRAPEHRPLLDKAVPTIGADRVVEALGFDGRGVNVAIIDTGIDYTHASFGGDGGYRQNNPGFIEPNTFPTAKVIGGWDFAGTNYTGGVPAPDNDPLDEAGHGTHVAGIAAGLDSNPKVPHGVAPGANLVALKVFGRAGGTNIANDAVEWCVESNLGRRVSGVAARCDVINMSLGSNWGYGAASSHSVMRRAVEAGIVVLASAGNSGDVAYITGSPAAALHAISVASTFAGGVQTDKIQATHGGRTEDIPAAEADPQFAPQMASVGTLSAPLAWLGRACTGDESAGDVNGRIALIAYGGCTSKEVIDRAQAEGAVGAVLFNDRDELFTIGSDANEFGQTVAIPAYAVRLSDGTRLRTALEGGPVEVLFSAAFQNSLEADGIGDTISAFSSRGPSRDGDFKPNLAAPGSNIVAPAMGSGDEPVSLSGTSMAAPMAAGAAALLVDRLRRQGRLPADEPMQPGLSAHGIGAVDVGALLINYVETVWSGSNRGGTPVPLARGGSGRINVLRSARAGTILRAGPIASINYGRVQFGSDVKEFEGESFTIRNISDAEKRYRIDTRFLFGNDEDAGVTYGLTDREMTVPAGGLETVTVLAEARAADMKPYGAYGGGNVMNRQGGVTDAEFDAHVVVTEVDAEGNPVPGGDVATLPIYMLPRATALVAAAANPVLVSPTTGVGSARFENDARFPGTAELFALAAVDEPDNTGPQLNVERVGIRVVPDAQGNRMIEFAIQTQRARTLPLESSFRIFLDTNRDGKFDHQLFNDDLFFFLSGGRTAEGAQRMLRMDVVRNSPLAVRNTVFSFQNFPRVEFAEVTLDSRQIIHRMYASALGYGAGAPIAFDAIVVHVANFEEIIGSSRYDPFDSVPNGGYVANADGTAGLTDQRIAFDERRLAFALDRASIPVERDGESLAVVTRRTPEGGEPIDRILAVYTQNLPGNDDVEVITLEEGEVAPPPTYTPTVEATPTQPIVIATQPPPSATSGPPTGGGRILLPFAIRAHELR